MLKKADQLGDTLPNKRDEAQKQLEKLDSVSEARGETAGGRSPPVAQDLPSSGPQKKQALQEAEVQRAKVQSSMTSRMDDVKEEKGPRRKAGRPSSSNASHQQRKPTTTTLTPSGIL